MEDTGNKRGRPATGKQYPHELRGYEDDEGLRLLKELARRRGVSVASLLRLLVREEAARAGVE